MKNLKIYGLDLRSLALFRILLGTFLLYTFGTIFFVEFDFLFHEETGLFNACFSENYLKTYRNPNYLYDIKIPQHLAFLVALIIVLIIFFFIGFHTKIATIALLILCWFFFNRYPFFFTIYGWLSYAYCLLFISIFLPVSHFFTYQNIYSLNIFDTTKNYESRNPFVFLMLFQIAWIYFYNGISKNGDYWLNGTAVGMASANQDLASSFTYLLAEHLWLNKFFTYATLVFEYLTLPLIFWPWQSKKLRIVFLCSVIFFHWGLAIFYQVGFYKYIGTIAMIMLCPDTFWDYMKQVFLQSKKLPTS